MWTLAACWTGHRAEVGPCGAALSCTSCQSRVGGVKGGEPLMQLLTTQQVADMLGVKPSTLRAWRCAKTGPPFTRLTKQSVKYDERDIQKFVAERRTTPLVR
jgi:hypothetical protein